MAMKRTQKSQSGLLKKIDACVAAVRKETDFKPEIAFILGTGLVFNGLALRECVGSRPDARVVRVTADASAGGGGVVCSPNIFAYAQPLSEGVMRVSALANYDRWAALDAEAYQAAKRQWYDRLAESAAQFVPDFRGAVVETDMFTPLTIRRFTGHADGAIYGSTKKSRDGTTHLRNLYICGNDQGLVGIVGALISVISIANRHLLK